MTFEILTPTDATLTSVTPRTEKHGDEDVFAISLGLKVTAPNTLLDTLAPGLRDSLYKAVEGQEQLPGVEPATPLLRCKVIDTLALAACFEGWTIAIDHGIDESDPITLGGAKVDKFRVVPSEGGSVSIAFRVGSNDIDAAEAGLLCSHLGQGISFTLKAPEARKEGTTEATGAEIDGTRGHPGADAGQGSLLDDQALTPVGALAASLEAGGSVEVTMPDGARATITRRSDPDDDSEGGTTDAGAAEQAELEAGMREQLTAAGVKPKRGAAKVH